MADDKPETAANDEPNKKRIPPGYVIDPSTGWLTRVKPYAGPVQDAADDLCRKNTIPPPPKRTR